MWFFHLGKLKGPYYYRTNVEGEKNWGIMGEVEGFIFPEIERLHRAPWFIHSFIYLSFESFYSFIYQTLICTYYMQAFYK